MIVVHLHRYITIPGILSGLIAYMMSNVALIRVISILTMPQKKYRNGLKNMDTVVKTINIEHLQRKPIKSFIHFIQDMPNIREVEWE